MSPIISIKDLDDSRISIYRSLKGKQLAKDGIFIAEGEKVVNALLNSDLEIVSALMTEKWFQRFQRQFNKKAKKGINIYIIGDEEMAEVIGFKLHQGIMVAVKIPPNLSLDKTAEFLRPSHFLLALNGIIDAENIGLIVRNCLAFSVDGIIADRNSYDPYLRRAVRVSMGAIFQMPVVRVNSLSSALNWLKKNFKTQIIAASPGERNRILSEADFSGNICIVFGSEAHGLSKSIVKLADSIVRIPILGEIDSLNVSCASAIFLYQAAGKRGRKAKQQGALKGPIL